MLPAIKQTRPTSTASGPASGVGTPLLPPMPATVKLLRDLLGVDVHAKVGPRTLDAATSPSVVYAKSDGHTGAGALCDLAFVVTTGAALSMIPAGVAAECLRAGRPTETIEENWCEVMNICSSLWNALGAAHVKLEQHYLPPKKAPPELALAFKQASARVEMEITVPGYPLARLSLVTFNLH